MNVVCSLLHDCRMSLNSNIDFQFFPTRSIYSIDDLEKNANLNIWICIQ